MLLQERTGSRRYVEIMKGQRGWYTLKLAGSWIASCDKTFLLMATFCCRHGGHNIGERTCMDGFCANVQIPALIETGYVVDVL